MPDYGGMRIEESGEGMPLEEFSPLFGDPSKVTVKDILDYFEGDIELYAVYINTHMFRSGLRPEVVLGSARQMAIQNDCRDLKTLWSWATGQGEERQSVAMIILAQPRLLAKVVGFAQSAEERQLLVKLYGATVVSEYISPRQGEGRAWLEDSFGL
jgi:hypothetical protein